jgi:hypothetical protein
MGFFRHAYLFETSYLVHIYSLVATSFLVVFVVLKTAGSFTTASVVAVATGKLSRLFDGQQESPPKDLNTPPIAFVDTMVEYLVLVLIAQAVTCEQSHLVNG